jgi:uncharacterized protein (DUF169 family)
VTKPRKLEVCELSLSRYAEEIERYVRPVTYPFAVRMLRGVDEIPEGAKRPKRDFGKCLSACQGFTLVRRYGMSIAMLKEDMWCPEPVIGFGLAETPQYFLEGHNRYPGGVESLEAGASWARELPRLEFGQYVGVVAAPLSKADFEPDVAVIYCNSAQLLRLLLAIAYKDGQDVASRLSGHAACVYAIVPAMQSGKCYVSVPCRGDRNRAGAQDDEMIFTVPRTRLDDLALGLGREGTGSVPTTPMLVPEYKLTPSYAKMARLMGMRKSDGSEIQGYSEKLPYE